MVHTSTTHVHTTTTLQTTRKQTMLGMLVRCLVKCARRTIGQLMYVTSGYRQMQYPKVTCQELSVTTHATFPCTIADTAVLLTTKVTKQLYSMHSQTT